MYQPRRLTIDTCRVVPSPSDQDMPVVRPKHPWSARGKQPDKGNAANKPKSKDDAARKSTPTNSAASKSKPKDNAASKTKHENSAASKPKPKGPVLQDYFSIDDISIEHLKPVS